MCLTLREGRAASVVGHSEVAHGEPWVLTLGHRPQVVGPRPSLSQVERQVVAHTAPLAAPMAPVRVQPHCSLNCFPRCFWWR